MAEIEEYKTFKINPDLIANARLARLCEICLNPFDIWSSDDKRRICPECRDKLYALLYRPLRPAPEWISVDYNNPETLPCAEKSILYCAFGRSVGEGYYRGFDGEHHVWKMYAVAGTHWDYEVTHWMPLPEPPEGGDRDATS